MDEKDALLRMETYCSSAEHCIYDVRQKLEKIDLSQEQMDSIVEVLLREKYIDEKRYSSAFVHDKIMFAKWGRNKISAMLWQKRIPQNIISEVLEEIDTELYLSVLQDVIASKRREVKGKTEYEKNIKLIKSVASRGFEIPLIKQFVNIEEEW